MRVMLGTAFEMMRDSEWDPATVQALNDAFASTVLWYGDGVYRLVHHFSPMTSIQLLPH